MHAAGVVHCDVKPANLLLGADGHLVLIDFGIAETDGNPAHPGRRNGYIIGSPTNMAPNSSAVRPRGLPVDLWSLGATLYAAVEGRPPFPQRDPIPTLAAVLHDPPSPTRLAGPLQPLLAQLPWSRTPRNEPATRPFTRC